MENAVYYTFFAYAKSFEFDTYDNEYYDKQEIENYKLYTTANDAFDALDKFDRAIYKFELKHKKWIKSRYEVRREIHKGVLDPNKDVNFSSMWADIINSNINGYIETYKNVFLPNYHDKLIWTKLDIPELKPFIKQTNPEDLICLNGDGI